MLIKSISLNSLLLGGFALLTAGTLATVNLLTKAPIAKAEQAAAQKALLEILPAHSHDNVMLKDTLPVQPQWVSTLQINEPANIYRARQNGDVVAVIIPSTAPDGYSGKIKLIVGINKDKTLAGVRVLAHTETPGLGDKIDLKKSSWILSFNGKSLQPDNANLWAVKKDGGEFDQFTGATITPRAVIKQVRATLAFADQNHHILFNSTPNETPEANR
jgi:Na+-translocating ferredoxin:NAD+ oxidoreductase subunit G